MDIIVDEHLDTPACARTSVGSRRSADPPDLHCIRHGWDPSRSQRYIHDGPPVFFLFLGFEYINFFKTVSDIRLPSANLGSIYRTGARDVTDPGEVFLTTAQCVYTIQQLLFILCNVHYYPEMTRNVQH